MNERYQFELNNKTYCLYFGTLAVKIFTQKSAEEFDNVSEGKSLTKSELLQLLDNDKSFCFIVYAGLCNNAYNKELPFPSFEDACELTEDIFYSENKQIQIDIVNFYTDSRATKAQLAKLNAYNNEKKNEEVPKKQIGTKSRVMRSAS